MTLRTRDSDFEHIFVARHGECTGSRLNDAGHQQVAKLGGTIREILDGRSAYLISSTETRALESSEILIAELGLQEFEQVPDLANLDSPDRDTLMRIIQERESKADGLVVVTHQEMLDEYNSDWGNLVDPGYALHVNNTGQGNQFPIIHLDNRFVPKD